MSVTSMPAIVYQSIKVLAALCANLATLYGLFVVSSVLVLFLRFTTPDSTVSDYSQLRASANTNRF